MAICKSRNVGNDMNAGNHGGNAENQGGNNTYYGGNDGNAGDRGGNDGNLGENAGSFSYPPEFSFFLIGTVIIDIT